jgi:hydroxyethylthiazole kinase-like uncharacterized protein yjeF
MTELLTAAQMRAIEQAAIDSGEVTGIELMERAGASVVEAIFEKWPELAKTDHCAVVLCGPGNNGGDGFVVARLLHEWGWEVEVFLYGDEDKLPPDAKVNCERWRKMGGVLPVENVTDVFNKSCVFIDALFGTGLSKPLPKEFDAIWDVWMRLKIGFDIRNVSIDLPSGICSDSGKQIGDISFATELVVSFHRPKIGHYIHPSGFIDGVVTKDIGLECWQDKWRINASLVRIVDPVSNGNLLDLVKTDEHKYDGGHAYVLSGPSAKTGAARLAARGALRIGAGVVTVASPPDAMQEHAGQLTAIMLTSVADAQALSAVLADERINAICIGPALGVDEGRVEVLAAVLKAKRATVVDADGLTLLSQNPDLMCLLHEECVLTPHGGEFARMFPDIAEKLTATPIKGPAYSKVDAAREAAKLAGCVLLYKGADTVIASPDGRCAINSAHYERSVPWLATAGSGDVLAGLITGLMARGFDPMQAAETAAWLHVECALKFGPGLISEDLPEQLPEVFRDLGL